MTDSDQVNGHPETDQPPAPEVIAQALRLRPERPQVTRLSRKMLAGATALALVLVSGAVLWALQNNQKRGPAPEELYTTDHHNVADGLGGLPKDYAGIPRDVPRLGPPLPGDLGRPIVSAQNQSGPLAADAELQRVNQESEAARTSKVFAATNVRPSAATTASNETPANAASSSDEAFVQNGQDRKLVFVNASVDRRTTSPDRLAKPASPFVVQAGTVIPAALITGIRSDLPGQITAQVTENVYDTPTGRARLIPQGARLSGIYDSQVAFGQSRVLLVWTRLIMPNGRSIVLERQSGAGTAGYAGLEDEVDNHWGELFKAAALSTLLGVGTELGSSGNDSDIIQALRRGAGDALNQTGQQVVRRNLNIQPTLTIRPGFPVRVIVNRDLVLEPYRG
ncbi:TrbI/VirB10 family protein [Bradyrhizobium sp.]|uniref:TrbI/VirB10 family protein n=1 Tax=Bradyrhizobium sp. TaxID=376 RepID=UPI003C7136B5